MRCLVLGAGGFIGNALVSRLKAEGHYVRGIGRSLPKFSSSVLADNFQILDLRWMRPTKLIEGFDEVYQVAANMGGAGFVFSGQNDAQIMRDNVQINANMLAAFESVGFPPRMFFASSACVYPDADAELREDGGADPASAYGAEKLFAEWLYAAHQAPGRTISVGRLDTVYGPGSAYDGGREKAPMALCRKIAAAADGGRIEVWGSGEQIRSFLYIDDLVDAVITLTRAGITDPVNIAGDNPLTVDELAMLIARLAGKRIEIDHISGPRGVLCRSLSIAKMYDATGWRPSIGLADGLAVTYGWVAKRVVPGTSPRAAS